MLTRFSVSKTSPAVRKYPGGRVLCVFIVYIITHKRTEKRTAEKQARKDSRGAERIGGADSIKRARVNVLYLLLLLSLFMFLSVCNCYFSSIIFFQLNF